MTSERLGQPDEIWARELRGKRKFELVEFDYHTRYIRDHPFALAAALRAHGFIVSPITLADGTSERLATEEPKS